MCVVKTPKIKPGDTKPPEPTIIRNPYLDGVGPEAKALRRGRSSLRIERGRGGGSATPRPSAPPAHIAPAPYSPPVASPSYGGGLGGGGGWAPSLLIPNR